jgi:transposase-like protein
MDCPDWKSMSIVKNGNSPAWKQKYKGMKCQKQFVENPMSRVISNEKKALIDALLLERISLRGIGRTVKVSLNQRFVANVR